MSQLEVDKIVPQSGTTLTIGDSGDTITVASGATLTGDLNADNLTSGTVPDGRITGAYTGITNLTMSGDLTVDTNTLFVNSTNNRVGIGTTSPSYKLSILEGGSNFIQFADGADAVVGSIIGRSSSKDLRIQNSENANTAFWTNNTERMRIDSSGNLLVGKTNNALSNDGIVIREGGEILATNTSDLTANFNRLSTDGDIVSFYKDGTTIGKIGVFASDNIYLSGNSSHAGIQFGSESVLGFKNSSIANNTLDLGNGTAQWRDLYLGGGLYVGGTGTANKLDDYEEGTWTPTISDGTTNWTGNGWYRKTGSLVFVQMYIATPPSALYNSASTIKISNYPFDVPGINYQLYQPFVPFTMNANNNYGAWGIYFKGTAFDSDIRWFNDNAAPTDLVGTDLNSNTVFRMGFSYITN